MGRLAHPSISLFKLDGPCLCQKYQRPIEWAKRLCSLKFPRAERSPSDLKTGLQGSEFDNFYLLAVKNTKTTIWDFFPDAAVCIERLGHYRPALL